MCMVTCDSLLRHMGQLSSLLPLCVCVNVHHTGQLASFYGGAPPSAAIAYFDRPCLLGEHNLVDCCQCLSNMIIHL